jgi:hypothetical protein
VEDIRVVGVAEAEVDAPRAWTETEETKEEARAAIRRAWGAGSEEPVYRHQWPVPADQMAWSW